MAEKEIQQKLAVKPVVEIPPKVQYVVRNKTRNIGYYYLGKEGFPLGPNQFELLSWRPTLTTAEISLVEVRSN